MDRAAFAFFDAQRRAYFPPERNQLSAHLTLFHALPPSQFADIGERLRAVTRGEMPFEARCAGLLHLGRGVAYRIETPALTALREGLADAWLPLLSAQDRAPFRAHVTVQNKVTPGDAKALLEQLRTTFQPFGFTIVGLDLWRYLGGPWDHAAAFRFRGNGLRPR